MKARRRRRRRALLALLILLSASLPLVGIWARVRTKYAGRIVSVEAAPPERVAIVFGAGLTPSGTPSAVLEDRVLTAVALYRASKVGKLLMSGDNSRKAYDESSAMKALAMEHGVPPEDIGLDYAGFRTYDTCYRAREIFGVRSALLVTQRFHLPRALYIANGLGIEAHGVAAERRTYTHGLGYRLREFPACVLAWVQVNITRPKPYFLGPKESL